MSEQEIGTVTHFFGHLDVAAVAITAGGLAVGDTIRIKGHTSDFTTRVESMQLEHLMVSKAQAGDNVGIKVASRAHEHDKVYLVTP